MTSRPTRLLLVDQTTFESLAPKRGARYLYIDHALLRANLKRLDEVAPLIALAGRAALAGGRRIAQRAGTAAVQSAKTGAQKTGTAAAEAGKAGVQRAGQAAGQAASGAARSAGGGVRGFIKQKAQDFAKSERGQRLAKWGEEKAKKFQQSKLGQRVERGLDPDAEKSQREKILHPGDTAPTAAQREKILHPGDTKPTAAQREKILHPGDTKPTAAQREKILHPGATKPTASQAADIMRPGGAAAAPGAHPLLGKVPETKTQKFVAGTLERLRRTKAGQGLEKAARKFAIAKGYDPDEEEGPGRSAMAGGAALGGAAAGGLAAKMTGGEPEEVPTQRKLPGDEKPQDTPTSVLPPPPQVERPKSDPEKPAAPPPAAERDTEGPGIKTGVAGAAAGLAGAGVGAALAKGEKKSPEAPAAGASKPEAGPPKRETPERGGRGGGQGPRGAHNVSIDDSCPSGKTKTSTSGAPPGSKRCNDQTPNRWHRR